MTVLTKQELLEELGETSANGREGGTLLENMIDSLLSVLDVPKLIAHQGPATATNPIALSGEGPVDVDTYTFTTTEDADYKLETIIRWQLTVANTSALFDIYLDGDLALEARVEPKDGNNEDFFYVYGIVPVTAGEHTIELKASKSSSNGQLFIYANSFTRQVVDTIE